MGNSSSTVLRFSRFSVYRFTSDDHEPLIILAVTVDEAVNMFLLWRAHREIGELPFSVEPGWGSSLSPAGQAHLAAARSQCTETSILGLYEASTGWTLCDAAIGTDQG